MDTLYDLLGALPRDDADDLRVAFRRAVKGAHPDLRPGDPDAALKFRQIVRANEILADPEQRAAYDHLMTLARQERGLTAARPIAARVHRVASGVMAFAGASIATAGGYLLFMHMSMSMALVAPPNNIDVTAHVSASIAAVSPADPPDQAIENAIRAKRASAVPGEVILASAAVPINLESLSPFNVGTPADPAAPNDAGFFRKRGISAYRRGELSRAISDLDHAIQLDPKSSASYIDRGIVFYRLRKFDRAFADIARAKQIENKGGPKPLSMMARKLRLAQNEIAPSVAPKPQRRTDARGSRGFASAFLRRNAEVPALRRNAEAPDPGFCNTAACLPPS